MRELGIDISSQHPKMLSPEMLDTADKVITMTCGVEGVCPASIVPSEDWQLEDPEGESIKKAREIRNAIEIKVKNLVNGMRNELH